MRKLKTKQNNPAGLCFFLDTLWINFFQTFQAEKAEIISRGLSPRFPCPRCCLSTSSIHSNATSFFGSRSVLLPLPSSSNTSSASLAFVLDLQIRKFFDYKGPCYQFWAGGIFFLFLILQFNYICRIPLTGQLIWSLWGSETDIFCGVMCFLTIIASYRTLSHYEPSSCGG